MIDPERSSDLLQKADRKLRVGYFDEALKLYAASMEGGDVFEFRDIFESMGMTFYLKGDLPMAVKCYTVYNRLSVLESSEMLEDYQKMLRNKARAKDSLLESCCYLASSWGWIEARRRMDENHYFLNENNEQIHRELLVRNIEYRSLSKGEQVMYEQYVTFCKGIGYKLIFDDFQKMIDDWDGTLTETKQYIREIFDAVKRIFIAGDTDYFYKKCEKKAPPIKRRYTGSSSVSEEYYDLINLSYDSLGFDSEQDMEDFFDGINDD